MRTDSTLATFTYDGVGNPIASMNGRGYITSFAYDPRDLQIAMQDALGYLTTSLYDARRVPIAMQDPLGYVTSLSYTARRQLQSHEDALGYFTTFSYDPRMLEYGVLDALGRRATSVYDPLGRPIAQINALGIIATIGYDPVGNLTSYRNGLGYINTSLFDARDLHSVEQDPLGRLHTFSYNGREEELSYRDALGQLTSFVYTPRGQEAQRIYADGTQITTTYDAVGNLLQILDPSALYINTFDVMNRLSSINVPGSTPHNLYYSYDANGNRSLLQTSQSLYWLGTLTYTYDARDLLQSLADPGYQSPVVASGITTFAYDPRMSLLQQTNPNGTLTTSIYDALERVQQRLHWSIPAASELDHAFYSYDAVSRPIFKQTQTGVFTYGYDLIDQLVSEFAPPQGTSGITSTYASRTTYAYDQAYRRTLLQSPMQWVTSLYDAADELIVQQTLSGPITLTYNANGSALSVLEPYDATTFTWDAWNRLGQVELLGGQILTQVYRYDDLRVEEFSATGSSTFTYDADNVFIWHRAGPQTALMQINCGGTAQGTFSADTDFSPADSPAITTTASIDTSQVTNPAPQGVYQSARTADTGLVLTYTLPGLTPNVAYTLRLHFAEIQTALAGARFFDIYVTSSDVPLFYLETHFDPATAAGGAGAPVANTAYISEYTVAADSTGTIQLGLSSLFWSTFTPPLLNGLEVLPVVLTRQVMMWDNTLLRIVGSQGSYALSRQYHLDAQSSVQVVSTGNGAREVNITTDAWGNVVKGATAVNPFDYIGGQGYWNDAEVDLTYVRARWLDTDTGSWLSVDPMRDELRYSYAGNRPTTHSDPSGGQAQSDSVSGSDSIVDRVIYKYFPADYDKLLWVMQHRDTLHLTPDQRRRLFQRWRRSTKNSPIPRSIPLAPSGNHTARRVRAVHASPSGSGSVAHHQRQPHLPRRHRHLAARHFGAPASGPSYLDLIVQGIESGVRAANRKTMTGSGVMPAFVPPTAGSSPRPHALSPRLSERDPQQYARRVAPFQMMLKKIQAGADPETQMSAGMLAQAAWQGEGITATAWADASTFGALSRFGIVSDAYRNQAGYQESYGAWSLTRELGITILSMGAATPVEVGTKGSWIRTVAARFLTPNVLKTPFIVAQPLLTTARAYQTVQGLYGGYQGFSNIEAKKASPFDYANAGIGLISLGSLGLSAVTSLDRLAAQTVRNSDFAVSNMIANRLGYGLTDRVTSSIIARGEYKLELIQQYSLARGGYNEAKIAPYLNYTRSGQAYLRPQGVAATIARGYLEQRNLTLMYRGSGELTSPMLSRLARTLRDTYGVAGAQQRARDLFRTMQQAGIKDETISFFIVEKHGQKIAAEYIPEVLGTPYEKELVGKFLGDVGTPVSPFPGITSHFATEQGYIYTFLLKQDNPILFRVNYEMNPFALEWEHSLLDPIHDSYILDHVNSSAVKPFWLDQANNWALYDAKNH